MIFCTFKIVCLILLLQTCFEAGAYLIWQMKSKALSGVQTDFCTISGSRDLSKTMRGIRFQEFKTMYNLKSWNLIWPRFMHNFSSYEHLSFSPQKSFKMDRYWMVMVKKCPNLMMRRTHVPAYRLLRSLSNKYIIFSSHYRTPCIIGTCLSPLKTSPEVIFLPKNLFQGKGVGIFIY